MKLTRIQFPANPERKLQASPLEIIMTTRVVTITRKNYKSEALNSKPPGLQPPVNITKEVQCLSRSLRWGAFIAEHPGSWSTLTQPPGLGL